MKSDERYDAKVAYNKKLSSKARMHYLENDIADRKGHAGTYSGNHPRYSSPAGMMGQAKADLTYNPMDDIAGQGTEGMTPGAPTANLNKGYGQQVGKPSVAKMYGGKKKDMSKSRRDYK
jgi:hypothetical protein